MAEFTTSIDIAAAPAEVFDYLVTSRPMTSWRWQHAVLEPRPGGIFSVDIAGFPIRGEYLEIDPPRRVVMSWGVAGSDEFCPGAFGVEFVLTATARGPQVEVTHSGLPDAQAVFRANQRGWLR